MSLVAVFMSLMLSVPSLAVSERRGMGWVRDHPAVEATAAEVALVPAPPTAPECDVWCEGIGVARAAEAQGDMAGVIVAMAGAYRVPELAGWGLATAMCESGLNPTAWSGYYEGLFQHDPGYWPARAVNAGWPGASTFDPVANAGVTMWMRSAGYFASNWPNCP